MSNSRKKTLSRSDSITVGVVQEFTDPKTVTLTGKPANSRAFKMIRSDNTEKENGTRVQRLRRSDLRADKHIASVSFPADLADASITEALGKMGLGTYELKRSDTAVIAAPTVALQGETMEVLLAPGVTAQVLKRADAAAGEPAAAAAAEASEPSCVTVHSITIDHNVLDANASAAVLQRWGIDFDGSFAENATAGKTMLVHEDAPEGKEVRTVAVADGVEVTVSRSDVYSGPEGLAVVVNEASYGDWGWGHLDFNSALADVEFSDKAAQAVGRLESVTRRILLYSGLPLETRKLLIMRATTQFGEYVAGLIDVLPREVVIAAATLSRSDKSQPEKQEMPETKENTAKDETGTPDEPQAVTLSRADYDKALADAAEAGAAAALAKHAELSRSDAGGAGEGEKGGAAAAAAPAAAAAEADTVTLSRSDVDGLNNRLAEVQAQLKDLTAGVTLVRSDNPDGESGASKRDLSRSDDQNPFAGVFDRMRAGQ